MSPSFCVSAGPAASSGVRELFEQEPRDRRGGTLAPSVWKLVKTCAELESHMKKGSGGEGGEKWDGAPDLSHAHTPLQMVKEGKFRV